MPAIMSVSAPASEIWLMGANGEEPERLLAGDQDTAFLKLVWQPDGARLAYLRSDTPSYLSRTSIQTVTLKDRQPKTILMDAQARLQDFCYLPAGRVIYSRSRTLLIDTEADLWEIKSDRVTGQPLGAPVRLTSWPRINFNQLSATLDGSRLVLLEGTSQSQIYVGELVAGSTRLKTEPYRLTHGEATYWPTGWTSDGKEILFSSDLNGSWELYKQRLDKQDPELLVAGTGFKIGPRISPDGKWILYHGTGSKDTEIGATTSMYVQRIPLSGGSPETVGSGLGIELFRRSRKLCVWHEPSADKKKTLLFEFDPLKGKVRQLATTDQVDNFDISPDGTLIAWPAPGSIRLLSLRDGKTWDVQYKGSWSFSGFDWAADGKGIFVGTSAARGGSNLMLIDLQGNVHPLWKTAYPYSWGVPSPDGRRR